MVPVFWSQAMAASWRPSGSVWPRVPAIRLAHLTEPQARALRLADNQIALNSGWDEALLAAEIARIRDDASVDLDVLGFSGMELDRLLAAADAGLDGEGCRRSPAAASQSHHARRRSLALW
jgi:ParB-like chromosome segregation protein Spo0J